MKERPEGASDGVVEAVGKASEAMEYLIRARGHLYSAHQLIGRVDFLFGDAADLFDTVGLTEEARHLRDEIVGRNVLDGRWTFQIVEEFDDLYFRPVEAAVRRLEDELMSGERHVFESELKATRRTRGHAGHEAYPKGAHDPSVDTGPDPDG